MRTGRYARTRARAQATWGVYRRTTSRKLTSTALRFVNTRQQPDSAISLPEVTDVFVWELCDCAIAHDFKRNRDQEIALDTAHPGCPLAVLVSVLL